MNSIAAALSGLPHSGWARTGGTKSRPFIQSLHSCELYQVFTQQHTRDAGSEVPPFAQLDSRKQHVHACRVLGRLLASRGVGVDEDNPGHPFRELPSHGSSRGYLQTTAAGMGTWKLRAESEPCRVVQSRSKRKARQESLE